MDKPHENLDIQDDPEAPKKCCQVCEKLGSGPNQDKPLKKCSKC